ncbi:MbtH family protein [Burkholderia gladioli]|uniref:MbtH family protein n=1 Tax=Burkholderia gladioli TaxID=28095 RepID=UPI003B980927
MESLFERDDARYQVLVNAAGQHSLWPESLDLPAGWQVALPAGPRREALDYVERHWAGLGTDQTA